MIPLRLTMRNFMCYRDATPTLDLTGVRLACLSGDNGAGKSALLDAMTWALWGKARVNSDTELMSLGATEMQVEFEFRIGEQDYRVTRRRTRRGAASIWLNFHVHDEASGAWRPLDGAGARETQQIITRTLGLEYETFINSALLLQGRADEFTTKPPGKRKEVLGDILGLAAYDDLEKRARERARARADDLREIESTLRRLETVIAQEPAHLAELGRLSAAVIDHDARIERQMIELRAVQERLAALQAVARDLEAVQTTQAADGQALADIGARAAACQAEIQRHEQVLARREEIEAGADMLADAQRQRALLDAALGALRTLERQRNTLASTIERERTRLTTEHASATRRLEQLQGVVARLPGLRAQRGVVAKAAAAVVDLEAEIARLQAVERQAHGEAERLRAHNDGLKREMQRLKDRQTQIDGADARCPLCRRPLGPDEKRHIHDDYQREGAALRDEYQTTRARIDHLASESARWEVQRRDLDRQREQAQQQAKQEARLIEQIEQAQRAVEEQVSLEASVKALADTLATRAYAPDERRALALLDQEIAALGYDEAAHAAARQAEHDLAPFAAEREALRAADRQLPREREHLATHQARAAELRAGLARAAETIERLTEQARALPTTRRRAEDLTLEIERAGRERDQAQQELGRVRAHLDACQHARDERTRAEATRACLAEERDLYLELVEAFGKKGIQAMIIETVVPELQEEANALLDRMPGNTMRVEFHTQRDNKAGDTIETLDVIIQDELGARKYELYSGGEAFRVNFAIRVALSKLLTRRAGARLQMLVIDEGFGTQDTRGREGLIEAIQSIEADFATILVVTHLSDIKDEFPARIDVRKELDGSKAILST